MSYFQDLVKGSYGRKIAYVDYTEVTVDNIVKIVAKGVSVLNYNRPIIKYLWDYKNGDQPVNYRNKTIRDDICNKVVENHAYEIVSFKVSQSYGEPIQFVSLSKDEDVNERVDNFNDYDRVAGKHLKNIKCGEWQSAVGQGYQAIGFNRKANAKCPYLILTPSPMNTIIVYSSATDEPLLAIQEMKDENNQRYYQCYSDSIEYRVANSKLISSKLHAFGSIPIVEYPNNQDRLSDIELVISMLDAVNNMQSNRMDSIEQFVQSWVKFINCDIDEASFREMKRAGALVVKSNNGDNKADVDIMTQELSQTESQVAKDDLWNNVLSIEAIPNKQGNTGGDTQGAVELRNGWDFSKSRARLKDPYIVEAEYRLALVKLNVLRVDDKDLALSPMDFEPQIPHSPQDNMFSKVQSLTMLLQAGIHPLIAIKVCGLWSDAEKVFLQSKEYLDVLYKTVENANEQEIKAKQLLENQ